MHHHDQQRAVQNMIQLAKGGNLEALHDVVDFARVAPHWCFADIANTLADLLTTGGISSAQMATINSLQGTPIYSAIEQEASINRLTTRARIGDSQALYDLVQMAKSPGYWRHPKVIKALMDVSVSKNARREHQVAVESLRGYPIFSEISERRQERSLANLIRAARESDREALRDLVSLAESGRFMDDQRIVGTLAEVFLSDAASKPAQALIWSLRDQQIYREEVTDSEHNWRPVQSGDEGGYVDDGPRSHFEYFRFWEYLQKYRATELERWLAKERR